MSAILQFSKSPSFMAGGPKALKSCGPWPAGKELFVNSSKDALICFSLDDSKSHQNKAYFQCKLNEIPSSNLKEEEYNYSANINADFKTSDHLSVFIWNINKQAFYISKFNIKIYNYNYQIVYIEISLKPQNLNLQMPATTEHLEIHLYNWRIMPKLAKIGKKHWRILLQLLRFVVAV